MGETKVNAAHQDAAAPRHVWLALAVLLAGAFMALLDTTIVNVALPAIRSSIGASNTTLSWIVSGYALAFGLALVPAGRIGDQRGHKGVFVIGLSLFTAASLACGLARNNCELIAGRAVQGLAGGIFFTTVTALVQLMFSGAARSRAFALLGAVIGLSTALGPLAGGVIIEAFGRDRGWRLVFGVNVPIGVAVVAAAMAFLPEAVGATSGRRADWCGLALLCAALVALLAPLIEGEQAGWPWWTYTSVAAGITLLGLFGAWERRLERTGGDALVPPRLFVHRSFTGGVLLSLVYFAAFTSIFFTIALLWQVGLGHSALQSGLVVTPFAVGSIVGAAQSDTLTARFGRTIPIIGLGMVTIGIAALWWILRHFPAADYAGWQLAGPLSVAGIGSGLFIAPNVDFIVATVDQCDAGSASGVIGTMQRIGSAIGIAVVGAVLFGNLHFTPGPHSRADAFGHASTLATAASLAFSVAALGLAFALPTGVTPGGPKLSSANRWRRLVIEPSVATTSVSFRVGRSTIRRPARDTVFQRHPQAVQN